MELGLVVLVAQHAVEVDVKKIRGVERTSLGLGVELGAEDGTGLVDHALVARVVQVGEVRLPVRRQGCGVNRVTVILTRDVAATGAHVQSGDVVSTVTVLELDGAGTSSQGQELVTQADTEDGNLRGLHQAAQVVDGILAVSRVTGTVRDENTIKVVGNLVDGEVVGEHGDTGATANQATQNVLLHTTVDDSHVALRVRSANVEGSLGADLADKVDLLRVGKGLILVGIVLLTHGDTGQRRTLLTQVGDNFTSVDARDGRNTLTSTPFSEALNSRPVAVALCNIGNDDTGGLEVGGLKVLEKTMVVLLEGGDTVVANEGLGEDQDLAPVGRIGQGLGVTDQRGGEDGLTGNVGAGSEGLPVEDRTISDRESGAFRSRLLTNCSHEARLDASIDRGEGWGPDGHRLEDSSEHCMYSLLVCGRDERQETVGIFSEASGSFPEVIYTDNVSDLTPNGDRVMSCAHTRDVVLRSEGRVQTHKRD